MAKNELFLSIIDLYGKVFVSRIYSAYQSKLISLDAKAEKIRKTLKILKEQKFVDLEKNQEIINQASQHERFLADELKKLTHIINLLEKTPRSKNPFIDPVHNEELSDRIRSNEFQLEPKEIFYFLDVTRYLFLNEFKKIEQHIASLESILS